MNISLIILTAVISTIGPILIEKHAGRRNASTFKQILGLFAAAPIISILLEFIFVAITDIENAGAESLAESLKVAEEILSMIPENFVSAIIGDIIGVVAWSIFRFIRRNI